MKTEADQGRWLLAKARQLKERALGTADTTRRKQFLLIATEYQKLAQQEDGGVTLDVVERMVAPSNSRTPELGVVTNLRLEPRRTPAPKGNAATQSPSRLTQALRRPEAVDMAIWAVLALVAFGLLLMPGDQTTQGLHAVFNLLID